MVAAWLDRRTLRAKTDRRLNCLMNASLRATKFNFHIKPEKKGVDLYAGLEFFLDFGVKIWGIDLYVQSTYT